jgi:2-polyprenyl-6-hydroxyphenyl methylase/3-demethylubiquinone-9 3-methyltransferase
LFQPCTEDLVNEKRLFDSICALEILEHVSDPQDFINSCFKLIKPGGILFFSTINRTPISYLATIALAEHVLKWVPPGTHQYEKYITPFELEAFVLNAGGTVLDTTGMVYNPFLNKWSLASGKGCADLAMNYIVTARKPIADK